VCAGTISREGTYPGVVGPELVQAHAVRCRDAPHGVAGPHQILARRQATCALRGRTEGARCGTRRPCIARGHLYVCDSEQSCYQGVAEVSPGVNPLWISIHTRPSVAASPWCRGR
jgi:hypothetical protein